MDHTYQHIEEIVEGLRKKDPNALKALYATHGGAINGIITRMIQDKDIAKEVLQDCFLRIWNKIDLYDADKGRFFTWMAQMARNIAKDKIKSKEFSKKSKTDTLDNVVSNVTSQVTTTQREEDIGIRELQHKLREEEQIIINYIYFKGYTQQELSDELNIPIGTIKTRLRMAINNLRKTIGVKK